MCLMIACYMFNLQRVSNLNKQFYSLLSKKKNFSIENSQSYVNPTPHPPPPLPFFFYQKEIEYDVGSAIVYMKLKMQHQIGPSPFFWWTERLLKFKTQTALDRIINLTVQQDSIKDGVLILQWVCFSQKKKKDPPMGVTLSLHLELNLY